MPEIKKALDGLKGVTSTEGKMVSDHRGTFRVGYDPRQATPEEIVKAAEKSQPEIQVHVGKPEQVPLPGADIDYKAVSNGGSFEIEKNLAKGKTTIFFFYFDGHASSTRLGDRIDMMTKRHPEIAIRAVNLGNRDWTDNAGRQLQRDFGVQEAPYVRVYGKDGKLIREVKGDRPDEVEGALK